jgi:hypothetical protein
MLLATSCGKSEVTSAGNADTPITKSQAMAYARAVNLRASDVPGLVVTGASDTAKGPLGNQAETCGIAAHAGTGAGITSQTFQRFGAHTNSSKIYTQTVLSTVYVMQNAAQAARETAAIGAAANNPAVVTCVKHAFANARPEDEEEEHHAGPTVGNPTTEPPIFSHVEVSALRSDDLVVQAMGLQIKAHSAIEAPGRNGPSNIYVHWLGYAVGPAVITLVDVGNPRPFPTAIEQRLLLLLYRRAKTHKL